MNLSLTEEQLLLRDSARRFLREQYSFDVRRQRLGDRGMGGELWTQFANMGWLAMSLDEELGGSGAGPVEIALLCEELGRVLALEPFVDSIVLAGSLLQAMPSTQLRDDLLRGLGAGEIVIAVAVLEPGARYAGAAGGVVAGLTSEGCTELTGRKILVRGGGEADMVIVAAVPPEGNPGDLGLYLVTMHGDSCARRTYSTVDGCEVADLSFDRTAAVDLAGGPMSAAAILDEALDRATVALCAEAVGCMEAVIELTAVHLRTRKQFGKTLGSFQALQHRMAEMHVECEYARAMIYKGLQSLTLPADERQKGVSAAKIRVCQAGLEVGAQGIQLHGGIGMTEEYPVGHYYRRLLVIEKTYGDLAHHFGRFEARSPLIEAQRQ
ncbi:acyl-CoA dehydrogenase family protein [Phenylobacterium sp. SCN 70-31]|uniref:acyl-CoA dehydrogenase family protein n=1 Tax=Phenylobacterium sp. SCN 70-31 TaxID=1660129 RepID=UPI000869EB87|nr:acyl-CoA dehydrogenase family protein [Phenylobacterium sp. SCN 70-31]ODT88317.1 MAG: hypothetical protein ABS78_06750 [Phenylobacterium sp. SCN 70-31]